MPLVLVTWSFDDYERNRALLFLPLFCFQLCNFKGWPRKKQNIDILQLLGILLYLHQHPMVIFNFAKAGHLKPDMVFYLHQLSKGKPQPSGILIGRFHRPTAESLRELSNKNVAYLTGTLQDNWTMLNNNHDVAICCYMLLLLMMCLVMMMMILTELVITPRNDCCCQICWMYEHWFADVTYAFWNFWNWFVEFCWCLFFKNGPRPQCCYSWATGHRSRSTQGAEFDGIPKKCPKTRVLQIPQNGNFDGNDGNYMYIYIYM